MIIEIRHAASIARIDLVALPSHTSHVLQPLDVYVFKSFKNTFYVAKKVLTMDNICKVARNKDQALGISRALRRIMSLANVQVGF